MNLALLPGRATAVALLLLTGCELSCPLNMPPPPTFILVFSTDTLTSTGAGFRRAELRSAYLVHYATADFQRPIDTLRQLRSPAPVGSAKPFLSLYYPFGHAPQFAVPDYGTATSNYRLLVPAASRSYDITDIQLTQEPGEKRCDGYRITRREATVNGQRRDGLNNPPELTK
ncbi:hypothetical protein [Hymenobacter negativus]|uniref:Lipoprotein n=1 Tax=Hymenobacter negativus TaxID=2795026 RepID=A0ABS3QL20_9BACT|nr:hypothetical protein [Hymenobacter negativus]MBO2011857.1 hypothetical protein [Hymenobacter negativus]